MGIVYAARFLVKAMGVMGQRVIELNGFVDDSIVREVARTFSFLAIRRRLAGPAKAGL
jgi:hypothetical protein